MRVQNSSAADQESGRKQNTLGSRASSPSTTRTKLWAFGPSDRSVARLLHVALTVPAFGQFCTPGWATTIGTTATIGVTVPGMLTGTKAVEIMT